MEKVMQRMKTHFQLLSHIWNPTNVKIPKQNLNAYLLHQSSTFHCSTCDNLGRHCHKLLTLNLDNCTAITDRSLRSIADGCRMLETLNISWYDSRSKVLVSSFSLIIVRNRSVLRNERHVTQIFLLQVRQRDRPRHSDAPAGMPTAEHADSQGMRGGKSTTKKNTGSLTTNSLWFVSRVRH